MYNYKVIAGIFAALYAYEAYANAQNVKFLKANIEKMAEVNKYYAAKLDEAGVPMTEFDNIAVETILFG